MFKEEIITAVLGLTARSMCRRDVGDPDRQYNSYRIQYAAQRIQGWVLLTTGFAQAL
jgi:hypothetical protein